jgi:hypothetical protein
MSDTPKHTPKPWEWEGTQTLWGGNPRAIVIEATVDGDDYGEHYGVIAHHWDDGVAGANRALIKAAPELLEALEKIARIYEDPEPTSMHDLTFRAYDMRCIARAAIAKAKP